MKRINKIFCLLLAILMILPALPTNALAAEPDISGSTYGTSELDTYLLQHFAACDKSFDISCLNIPKSQASWLSNYILYEFPEAFHVYYVSVGFNNQILTSLSVTYKAFADTAAEYHACNQAIQSATNELLRGIAGNTSLTDVEKALLLHDRLAVWTAYDYENYLKGTLTAEDYCLYGVLGQQNGVCKGYAMAYMYLLKRVGIESNYCSSSNMNHAWNIVYIDGKAYHVDVTWDDPVWDCIGYVGHRNFLRSTEGIIESGHDGGDFITTPTDKTYDDYYWQNSYTAFALLNNELYYIDDHDETLRKADKNKTVLCSVEDQWYDPSVSGWWQGLARLAQADNLLLFSQEDGIYGYDITVKDVVPVYLPDLEDYDCTGVYGFKLEKGQLILELGAGMRSGNIDEDKLIRVTYQKPATRNGWVWEKGYWYYFKNGVRQSGWLLDAGKWYYLEEDGAMHIGWYYENGNWYYMNSSGAMAVGWQKVGENWYYFKSGGAMVEGCDYTIAGKRHRFAFGGIWQGEITAVRNGWVYEGDRTYYYQNDAKVIGWKQIGGNWYFFDHYGGYMATETWLYSGGHYYYLLESGIMHTGWLAIGNNKYYLNSSGHRVTGEFLDGGMIYVFGEDGKLISETPQSQRNGWVKESGKWYYYKNGVKETGWLQQSSTWYYLKSDGTMATGWQMIGNAWYYFNTSGVMQTGWQKIGSTWYYFKSSGAMTTGWLRQGSTWYYFHASGAMATGTLKVGTKTYHFASSGACLNP